MHINKFSSGIFSMAFVALLVVGLTACSDDKPVVSAVPQAALTDAELLAKGNDKARMCVGCHGPKGNSRVASYPSLAGKSKEHLAEQLQAFRSGARDNPMMSSIAKSLADEDVLALAYYFSEQVAAGTTEVQP